MTTCFAFRVNKLWIVNAAGVSLCSQRLGFPISNRFRSGKTINSKLIQHGSGRIMIPIERRLPVPRSISIYQPIVRAFIDAKQDNFLQNEWLKTRTADPDLGYGKLFLQQHDSVQMYPDEASRLWIPSETWNRTDLLRELPVYVHRRIHEDYLNGTSTRGIKATAQGNA
jgi:hypothetical protein